jgi:hypothetical protein
LNDTLHASFGRSCWNDSSNESVALLGNGLDEARLLRLLAQRLAKLGNALSEHLIGDHAALPDLLDEPFSGNDLARPLGETHHDAHDAGLETHRPAGADDLPVQRVHQRFLELKTSFHSASLRQL